MDGNSGFRVILLRTAFHPALRNALRPALPGFILSNFILSLYVLSLTACGPSTDQPEATSDCVTCHQDATPGIVTDWELSTHSTNGVDCVMCHGGDHRTEEDVALAGVATPDVCATCHPIQVEQFAGGKHALAWTSMNAMPTTHFLPMALTEGMKGCGGCHRIGLKTEDEIKTIKAQDGLFGLSSCDVCHTRHLFSVKEAREPPACRTCHMGFDHPQWEMYASSKHGVRHLLKQNGTLPEHAQAPTCQTCHMPEGDHGVRTAWGFLAVRLAPAGRPAVGGGPYHHPPGPRRAGPRRQPHGPPGGGPAGRRGPADRGGLAAGARPDDRDLRAVPFG